ncbi:dynein axonemal heavy chain 7-like, partial [Centruroides vittatus]|uniref:dynein axonemal heavy chain 7-like n=1 Tax=Centruroides vittatus TaxID=120091 RepID=UPI00350F214B
MKTELTVENVKADIDEFRKHMPLIQTICNPGLKDRHWEEMSNLIGFELKHTEETTLDDMFEYHIEEYIPHIAGISDVATKEYNLEKSYLKMKQEWENTRFILGIHGDTETNILLSVDDIQQMLDDQIVKTGTMISSPYIKPFENDIKSWEIQLQLLQEIIDEWLKLQHTWMYLESIFSSPDIMAQMPEEGRRFNIVNSSWREIMSAVEADPQVFSILKIDKLLEKLKKSNELLDLIHKSNVPTFITNCNCDIWYAGIVIKQRKHITRQRKS